MVFSGHWGIFQGFFLIISEIMWNMFSNLSLLLLLMSDIINWDFFSANSSLEHVFKTEIKFCLLAGTKYKNRIPSLNFSQTVSDLGFKWGNMKWFQTRTVAINHAQSLLLIDLSNGWIQEYVLTNFLFYCSPCRISWKINEGIYFSSSRKICLNSQFFYNI